ncbi:MAG: hypothetical protein A2603_12725 [Bdellovibrionales bacterium RIFOXYD1_FULL_55_31]|nr:MAG: hypothetical protein A2603_12725 [Bdellovibrionales bacterium RIFOXYD1_FULL_55_31]
MKFLIAIWVGFFSLTYAALAKADDGGVHGGGGNGSAISIIQEASRLSEALRNSSLPGELREINYGSFDVAIQKTKIQISPTPLELDGNAVDAINYPDQGRIVFSEASVERLQGTKTFSILILHEYLGILRFNDQNYRLSGPTIDFLIANPPSRSYRSGYDDITCQEFKDGIQTGQTTSSAFHGAYLLGNRGIDMFAYFISDFLNGERRLFFRMEAVDKKTKEILAKKQMPANERLEGTLTVEDKGVSMYCWVSYL